MNAGAEQHLARAQDYLARGEAYYRRAAEEIVAAQKADPTLGQREIAERFGRSRSWVGDLVRWHTSGHARGTPFAEVTRASSDRSATKRVLRDAPVEQVEAIVADLPPERQKQLAALRRTTAR